MEQIRELLSRHPTLSSWAWLIFNALVASVAVFVLLKLERRLARKWISKYDAITTRFAEKVIRFGIVFISVMWVIMSSSLTEAFGNSLFQGTAVLAVIAGFAAKPVLSDMFCGFMLSASRPFNLGDRIELDDGTTGIVKDITIRHVVLQGIDTLRMIIPNSEINARRITNLSQREKSRSIHFRFMVGLNTPVDQAKRVIEEAVIQSPYTVPREGGAYSPVYFIALNDSRMEMAVTVYYEPSSPTEAVKDDVNTRVKTALDAAGIEIPYRYVNVRNTG